MRTTVDIEPDLLARLRRDAERAGIPFREMLARVLRRGLAVRERAAPPVAFPTYSMGPCVIDASLDRALALAASLEDAEIARKLDAGR